MTQPIASPPAEPLLARLRRLRPRWRNIGILLGGVAALIGISLVSCAASPSGLEHRIETAPPASLSIPDLPASFPFESFSPPRRDASRPPADAPAEAESQSSATYELDAEQARAVLSALAERGLKIDAPLPETNPKPAVQEVSPGATRTVHVSPQDTVTLRLALATREAPMKTLVTFSDETSIEPAVIDFPETHLDFEYQGNTLHLRRSHPKARGPIHIRGGSGHTYRLLLVPAELAEDYDGSVTIALRSDPAAGPHAPGNVEAFVRAMYLRANPVAVSVYEGAGELIYDHEGLQIRILWVYEGADLTGYVCRLDNARTGPILVERERFGGDGLLMVGAEDSLLEAGGATTLYLVYLRDDHGDE